MTDYDRIFAQRKLNRTAEAVTLPRAFTEKFPDLKADKAEKLFQRYLATVSGILIPRLPFLQNNQTYVSLDKLLSGCGEFRYKTARHYVWKEFKDIYPFINVLETGSNFKQASNNFEKNTRVEIVNERLLTMLLEDQNPRDVFAKIYENVDFPDHSYTLPIDMDNLDRFIGCSELEMERAGDALRTKLQSNIRQARLVRKVGKAMAEATGNAGLPLVPSVSPFGRTYYKGLNIQSVSKEVRSAIIGHHFQYDMNAAVYGIKLYIYGQINGGDNNIVNTPKGSYTREYLADKDGIRNRLAKQCFDGVEIGWEAKVKAIKRALTAIGFGAKATGKTWQSAKGHEGTALTEIIKSPAVRAAFVSDPWVKAFIAEQQVMETEILEQLKLDEDYDAICESVRGANNINGKISRGALMAYVYQQWETVVMDMAVAVVEGAGIEVVARIHDAFIVREKMPDRVVAAINEAWGFRDYLSLDCDEVREWVDPEYKRASRDADDHAASHRAALLTETKQAALYAFQKARAAQNDD
jgi:hypothetical protein